ncbi:MAG: CapA family protein [Deltaproteobacteria bacterium]
MKAQETNEKESSDNHPTLTLFLCGDVMPGRGIDQIMPHPSDPVLFEPYVRNARDYLKLAEDTNGPIPKLVAPAYIWGDSIAVLAAVKPDLSIINLETSVTTSSDYWPGKGINYRMNPGNIGCLAAAGIDCCVLANNHVLDWGYAGLVETLQVLKQQGIKSVGAGTDRQQAEAPAIFDLAGKGRLLVFAYGLPSSGIALAWAAGAVRPGVNLLPDLSEASILRIKKEVRAVKKSGDLVLFSLHWGGNWGYEIPEAEKRFAHRLIDEVGVDALFGHSSHHFKGIEVYRGKLILYGCGDFINDYEGISGYEQFRDDLTLMYFPTFDSATGRLLQLRLAPMQIKRFRLIHAAPDDKEWITRVLNREGKQFETRVHADRAGNLNLKWVHR